MGKFKDILQRNITNDNLHAEIGVQERFEDQEGLYRIDHKGRMVKSDQDESCYVQLAKHPLEVRLMANKVMITAVSDPNYTGFVEYKTESDAKLAFMPLNTPSNVFAYMRRNYSAEPSAYKWSTILVDEIHHRHLSNIDEAAIDAEAATENLSGIEPKDFSDMSGGGSGGMDMPSKPTPKPPTPSPISSGMDKPPMDKPTPPTPKPATTSPNTPKPPSTPTPVSTPKIITPAKPAGAPKLPTPAKPVIPPK